MRPNLEDGTPLCKACAGLVVLLAPRSERVEALGGGFAIGAGQLDRALVDLDAWNDIVFFKDLDKRFSVRGSLVEGLLEEDDTGDVGEGVRRGEEELP